MNSAQTRRVIAAGVIGNVLEWYDFAIYGYFASAIGRQFFPHEDAVAQLLLAFGVFALGFLMRPIGGAFVGHIGEASCSAPQLVRYLRPACRPQRWNPGVGAFPSCSGSLWALLATFSAGICSRRHR